MDSSEVIIHVNVKNNINVVDVNVDVNDVKVDVNVDISVEVKMSSE